MSTYKDLIAWQKSMELSRMIYRHCMTLSIYIGDDDYIKTSQLINEVEKMLSSLIYTLRFPRSAKKSEMKTY